ncbi:MAG: class I SAM-dependent methyltransferase [Flavobacteriaceae bacterium]|nr:class I SAM-dependent methyltransferase [Flavobacteriaceae bacterium]
MNTTFDKTWFETWFDTKYYHILYKNRDYSEAKAFMLKLTDFLKLDKDSLIIDLACGRGRHAATLFKLGYRVIGADLSENSILFAKEKYADAIASGRLDFYIHDMTKTFPLQADAVFNLFTSMGYFEDFENNQRAIQAMAQSLKPGGAIVIDFLNVHFLKKNLVTEEVKTEEGIDFHIKRSIENNKVIKDIRFTDQNNNFHFTEYVSLLTLEDFEQFSKKAGLNIFQIFGDYQLKAFNAETSPRLIIALKKPKHQ